jgi:hypothetical protein
MAANTAAAKAFPDRGGGGYLGRSLPQVLIIVASLRHRGAAKAGRDRARDCSVCPTDLVPTICTFCYLSLFKMEHPRHRPPAPCWAPSRYALKNCNLFNREHSAPVARSRLLEAPHIGASSCPRLRDGPIRCLDYAYLKRAHLGLWI